MTDATETKLLDALYPISFNQTIDHISQPKYGWNSQQFRLTPVTRIPTGTTSRFEARRTDAMLLTNEYDNVVISIRPVGVI